MIKKLIHFISNALVLDILELLNIIARYPDEECVTVVQPE